MCSLKIQDALEARLGILFLQDEVQHYPKQIVAAFEVLLLAEMYPAVVVRQLEWTSFRPSSISTCLTYRLM